MKKCLKLLSVMLVVCMILTLFGACVKNGNPTTAKTAHSITVDKNISNGKITVDKSTAYAGDTVKVTATPNENYVLSGITVNGAPVENGQFVMGGEDVVVSATFILDAGLLEQNPGVEGGTVIKAPSMGGSDANAQIFTVFGDTGIEFTAYVSDSGLADQDGMAILFSKKLPTINQLLPDGQTVKLEARRDGTVTLSKTDAEGKLVEDALAGSQISLKLWSKDGKVTTGYIVRATVTYEALGVTKDTAKGNITICPVVYNAYGSVNAKATALNGANEAAQNTFPVLSDDNTYLDNPFMAPSGQLGSAGGIMGADTWDLSKDYYKADTENYPNRVVTLTGHDNMDNNLVFVGVSAAEMYAEATIRVTGVANPNDQWPKFGLMLFNGGGQSGVFYYVDAIMSGASGNTEANIIGTTLGYNKGQDSWGSWLGLQDGVFDLGTLTIKLAMVYQDGWLHLYANDRFVESVYAGEYNENMHFGFKSFGLELEVTDYMASADAEADGWASLKKEMEGAEKLDILFAGDSYMDFWKSRYQNVHMADYTAAYANEGIGGTMVPLWIEKVGEMAKLYDPKSIVFHIGVNDIDNNAGVDTTVANLKTLFETYHALFPNAKIYWNSLIPNTMFPNKVTEYYQVNEQVKAYTEGKDWLVYIDQTASFEKEPGVANPIYFDDGLHLSPDIGYPLWVKNMLTAMGYTYEEGTTMGSENDFAHSGGWTYTDGTAYLNASNEMVTYFKGASGELVYVESMVTIGQLYNSDGYPKFGYVVHGAEKSVWGLVDAAGYPGQKSANCAFVLRENVINSTWTQREGWNWDKWLAGTYFEGSYADGNYIKMAIAKLGSDVYLLVNDRIVAKTTVEGEVTVGFQVFNLEVTIKDAVVIKDENVIREKLHLNTAAVIDGKADDTIWTSEVLANVLKTGDKGDGRYFETVAVKGPDGVYFLVTTYSNENTRLLSGNWWENANIEFRMGTDMGTQYYVYYKGPGFNGGMGSSLQVTAVASDGGVQLENGLWKTTTEFFVPYSNIYGCNADTAEIPVSMWGWVFDEGWHDGMNLDGVQPTVSKQGLRYLGDSDNTEGWTIDGVMGQEETWGEELRFLVEGNRAVSVWAVKGENGVYIYARAYTDTMIDTYADEWYTNHNFEFYLNHGPQSYVNTRNEAKGATKWAWNSVQVTEGEYAGKWMHTTEIFVQKSAITGFDSGDVILNYAFKASWENARWEGMANITDGRQDWWRTSLGCPVACETDFGKFEVPSWLKITATGLVNTKPAPTDGVVDAELNEYEGKNSIYGGNDNVQFHFMGYEGKDGVYLAVEIWQKNRAEATPEWHLNDNVEIQLNGVNVGFALFENFADVWGNVNAYAMKRVASDKEGYAYKTIVELYIKHNNPNDGSWLRFGCNGNGFGGWIPMYWDNNIAFINENGLFTDAAAQAAADGVTLDGKANEAFYADKNTVTFTPNGATVTMTGAKLEHGAVFLLTATHTRPVTDNIQGQEEWWCYLNYELYIAGGLFQARVSVWNGGWHENSSAFTFTTTDNGNGTYTTVMEVYIPYALAGGTDVSGDIQVALGTVIETGYAWCAEWSNNLYLTENGIEYK